MRQSIKLIQGLDVVVKTGYCIDSDATLRHELCHVKDAIDGKIDLQRADLLYRLGASINRKDLRIQAATLNTLSTLAYICGMYFNSAPRARSAPPWPPCRTAGACSGPRA